MPILPDAEELVRRRKALFDSLEAAGSLTDIARFQHELTSTILEAESHKRSAGKDREKRALFADHLHACRTYGDSLAWLFLHPHAIRQLAKNGGRPPHLGGQLESVAAALAVVDAAANQGVPAMVSDLTHCLRIGDVIVASDRERPGIIELKSGAEPQKFQRVGRRGRQFSRMEATTEYLRTGRAKFYDETKERLAIEAQVAPEFNWTTIDKVASQALREGSAWQKVSKYETIVVYEAGGPPIPAGLRQEDLPEAPFYVASHAVPLEEAWPSVSPPINWGVSAPVGFALMERDLELVHLFNPLAFQGFRHAGGEIRAVDVIHPEMPRGGFCIEAGNEEVIASVNFLNRVLYHFETVETVAKAMLETAVAALTVSTPTANLIIDDRDHLSGPRL